MRSPFLGHSASSDCGRGARGGDLLYVVKPYLGLAYDFVFNYLTSLICSYIYTTNLLPLSVLDGWVGGCRMGDG